MQIKFNIFILQYLVRYAKRNVNIYFTLRYLQVLAYNVHWYYELVFTIYKTLCLNAKKIRKNKNKTCKSCGELFLQFNYMHKAYRYIYTIDKPPQL